MSKASAIRAVSQADMGLTNHQIREMVWAKYGLRVDSNLIVNVIGSHKDRVLVAGYSPQLLKKAREFARAVGDPKLCHVLLKMVQS